MIALACLAACLGFAPSPAGVSPRLNLASSRQRTRAAPAAGGAEAGPPPPRRRHNATGGAEDLAKLTVAQLSG